MATNLWAAYVAAVVPSGERQEDIGKRAGQTQATISRWLSGKAAPDEAAAVAAFAKAYNRNVLEAFVAAGFLDEAEAGRGLPVKSRHFLADLPKDPVNQPATPTRTVRISDELWEAAQRIAADRGESVAEVIRRCLERYVRAHPLDDPE